MARVEFHESGDEQITYVIVMLDGRELGVFHPQSVNGSLEKLIDAAYRRGRIDGRAVMQAELKNIIGFPTSNVTG